MRTISQRQNMRNLCAIALLIAASAVSAQAQINAPLPFETVGAVTNEFGAILLGSSGSGPRVEFLTAPGGVINPPEVDGTPNPPNELILETHIGAGVLEYGEGLERRVSGALLIDRSQPTKFFARVFSEEGAFYGDSLIYTNPTAEYAVMEIELGSTVHPLDVGDDDGDGLNNSWETSYGSDRNNPDTDGDGMSDGDEHRAGTGLLDESSYLAMVRIQPDGSGLRVEWDTVPGKKYQLELSSPDPDYDEVYEAVGEVQTAVADTLFTTVTNIAPGPLQFFRVKLVEE
ncbi:MAG: thrombospondin type 3 repeat-containing protein [Kiritimatiellae bacterium]|nr:thrombospondin type 3 repeat-containing protein [Kiritimatiellia bacterium]